jgi:desulfoferrodoxin (superoxide reductase-like protein)
MEKQCGDWLRLVRFGRQEQFMQHHTRRDALKLFGLGLAALVAFPARVLRAEDAPGAAIPDLEAKADKMEKTGVLTPEAPGQWAGKEGSHTPVATVSGQSITVITKHEMTTEHWIHAIYLRDQDGKVVGMVALKPTDAEAKGTFSVPTGTTTVTPYSFCNKHGLWKGSTVSMGQ